MTVERQTNQSVEKAIGLLNVFADGQPQRVADVAKVSQLGQSTVSRLLGTLESVDLVERDPLSGLYRLGPQLITLAGVALNQHALYRAARQTAQNLAAQTRLGANVAILRGDQAFYLMNFEGVDAPRNFTLEGQANSLHATGIGKCLLLGVPVEERSSLLGALTKYTARTIVEDDQLEEALATAQQRGYATEVEEHALGRACVAAPIHDASNVIRGAISLSGPLSVLDLDQREPELASMVIEAADRIGLALGYSGG